MGGRGTDPRSPNDLPACWRERAADLRRWAAAEGAAVALEQAAGELEQALRAAADELLDIAQAAEAANLSRDHLRHLLASGALPNAGCRGRPRIKRGDLPVGKRRKPRGSSGGYDPVADAAALVARGLGQRRHG